MSAQQRYLTLVQHISKIYAADDGGIEELSAGLKDILTRINPAAAADWRKVQVDSKRLLRVWHSRADDDDAAADEVVDQIAESLKEFSAGGEVQPVSVVAEKPTLVVSEVAAAAPVFKTVTVTAVEESEEEDEEEDEEEEETPVVVVVKKDEPDHDGDIKMLIEELDAEEDEEEEEEDGGMDLEEAVASGGCAAMDEDDEEFAAAVAEAEAELEEDADAAESVVEEAKVAEETNKAAESEEVIEPADEEEVEESDAEAEAEEEEEEAEAEAEEAEEEGLEVEKRVIRGRPYWVDVNTNKLYAVIGDDDVGDEVGAIVNGKPVFRA